MNGDIQSAAGRILEMRDPSETWKIFASQEEEKNRGTRRGRLEKKK